MEDTPEGSSEASPRHFATLLHYAGVVLAAGLIAYLQGSGQRGTPDSTNYLNAALHLANGDGYVTSALEWGTKRELSAVTIFAPGFPALIALFLLSGLSPLQAMAWSVGVSYVAYAVACCFVLRAALPKNLREFASLFTVALMIQPALRDALHTALSDLFGAALALFSAGLILTPQNLRGARAPLTGIVLGAAILARWANLYFVVAAFVMLSLSAWSAPQRRERMLRVGEVGVATLCVLLPVWARNFAASGTLMGPRQVSLDNPLAQLGRALTGASDWFAVAHDALRPYPTLATAHGALALLLFVYVLLSSAQTTDERARGLWIMSIGYGLLMVLSSSTVRYDPLSDTRFWLLTLPLVTAAFLRSLYTTQWSVLVKSAVLAAWALVAGHATLVSARDLRTQLSRRQSPDGYFSPQLDASATVRRALALHDAGRCALASHDEFTLLPRVGLRPLRLIGQEEVDELSTHRGEPLCLLVIRNRLMPHTLAGEHAAFRASVHALSAKGHLRFDSQDEVAELWMTNRADPELRVLSRL